jgi:hypothetical protein
MSAQDVGRLLKDCDDRLTFVRPITAGNAARLWL